MPNENAGVKTKAVGTDSEQELNKDLGAPQDQNKDTTDWKALFEKEKEEKENYKKALDQKRQLRKESSNSEDEDKPATIKDVRKVVEDVVTPNKVESFLAEKVKDPTKREFVKYLYEERIRQTGSSDEAIQSDIEEAIDLAESKVNKRKASEMARIVAKDTTPPLSGSSSDNSGMDTKNHKFSADQVKSLTQQAQAIGADPTKFIENAWKNMAGR